MLGIVCLRFPMGTIVIKDIAKRTLSKIIVPIIHLYPSNIELDIIKKAFAYNIVERVFLALTETFSQIPIRILEEMSKS